MHKNLWETKFRDRYADTSCCRRVVIMNIIQQTLAIRRGYILEKSCELWNWNVQSTDIMG